MVNVAQNFWKFKIASEPFSRAIGVFITLSNIYEEAVFQKELTSKSY